MTRHQLPRRVPRISAIEFHTAREIDMGPARRCLRLQHQGVWGLDIRGVCWANLKFYTIWKNALFCVLMASNLPCCPRGAGIAASSGSASSQAAMVAVQTVQLPIFSP
jgi:hypothetical protein